MAASIDLNADDSAMVSGGGDRIAHVWDLESGRIKRTFVEHAEEISSVRISPDGQRAVSASNDSVRIWNTAAPEKIVLDNSGDLESRDGIREFRVTGIAWNPDRNRLATSSFDGHTRVWDLAAGKVIHRYDGHSFSVSWNPDGEHLAIGGNGGPLVATGQKIVKPTDGDDAVDVRWNSDGSFISAGIGDRHQKHRVRVYEYPSLEQKFEWRGHPTGIAWNPHDSSMLACAVKSKIFIMQNGEVTRTFVGHKRRVKDTCWSPDGKLLATCGDDGTIVVHDFESEKGVILDGHTSAVWAVDWHPNGRRLVSGGADGTIRIWDTNRWREVLTLNGGDTAVSAVAWSPDGRQLATGNQLGQVTVWDAGPGFPVNPNGTLAEWPTKNADPEMTSDNVHQIAEDEEIDSKIGEMLASDEWEWTEPQRLNINTEFSEFEPWVSADELTLMFHSDRPGGAGEYDIYICTRKSKDDPWSEPENVTEVNSQHNDEAPHMSADGLQLWFSSSQVDEARQLWVSHRESTVSAWSTPQRLPHHLNSYDDADIEPSISEDRCTLAFCSTRVPRHGMFDLWMCTRPSADTQWGTPVRLGDQINADEWQGSPCLIGDGFGSVMVFHSQSVCQFSVRRSPNAVFKTARPLDPDGRLGAIFSPYLTPNGESIYYRRYDVLVGTHDLWTARRVKKTDTQP